MLEGESGVGTSGEGHLDIRNKIIGAIQGMREGLPLLDDRLAELEQYVEEEHSEAEYRKKVAEVLMDISSFAKPLSALVEVVEGSLKMCEGGAVKLKKARESVNQFTFLSRVGQREAKMLIIMSVQS